MAGVKQDNSKVIQTLELFISRTKHGVTLIKNYDDLAKWKPFSIAILSNRKQNQTHFTYLAFVQYVISNVTLVFLPQWMQRHTSNICLIFHRCVFSNVSSNCQHREMHSHTGYIYLTFPHCGFSDVSSNGQPQRMHSHIGCIYLAFLHCVFLDTQVSLAPTHASKLVSK